MGSPDLARVREQFLDAVYDPHDPYTATDVPYRLLDAMARLSRPAPEPPTFDPEPVAVQVAGYLDGLGLSIFPTETAA